MTDLIPFVPDNLLTLFEDPILAGEFLNDLASKSIFADYRQRLSPDTCRRHRSDLAAFAEFLTRTGLRVVPTLTQAAPPNTLGDLGNDPDAWKNITWGIVKGYAGWMLRDGFALATINARLSSVRTYARLAMQAGSLDANEFIKIKEVKGYSFRVAERVNEHRGRSKWPIRKGAKKAEHTSITFEQARSLKNISDDTPRGRRDRLMMCILLDHGLRVGELVRLRAEWFFIQDGVFRFYRPKVGIEQTHELTKDTIRALNRVIDAGELLEKGPLIRRLENNGVLGKRAMSLRGANNRVGELGMQIGVENLSPHDCRHYWATAAARAGTDPFVLQEAGGWASLQMPRRYVEQQMVANKGLRLE